MQVVDAFAELPSKSGKALKPGPRSRLQEDFPSVQPSMARDESLSSMVQDSFAVCPEVKFPPIVPTLTAFLETLANQQRKDLEHIPYKETIAAMGGVQTSAKILADAIHPLIKGFDNKVVTTEMLCEVREKQSATEEWEMDSGYMSFITDDRSADYWRPYVGQSHHPKHRIMQHITAILNGEDSTLHYYIVAQGAGHRSVNFIKLWTLVWPDHIDEQTPLVFANILEMFMARCFQSLAPGILKEYFGSETEYSGTGLNVVPPLLQGISLTPRARYSYSLQLEKSPDLEIREWPHYRQEQRKKAQPKAWTGPRLKRDEYLAALTSAASEQLGITDLKAMDTTPLPTAPFDMHACLRMVKNAMIDSRELVGPRGTRNAQVGIILDQNSYLAESQPMSHGAADQCAVPWGIRESGFSEKNSLIWSFTFYQEIPKQSTTLCFKQLRPEEADAISQANKSLIQASNLRFIIFSGAEITRLLGLGHPVHLSFNGIRLKTYIEHDGACIKRVYIHASRPLSILWANAGPQITIWCELSKFTATVLGLGAINATYYERARLTMRIVRLYCAERDGKCKQLITAELADADVLDWLYHKGFRTKEAIQRLESIGGTFIVSLLLLLVSVPRRAAGTSRAPVRIPQTRKRLNRPRVFTTKQILATKDLLDEMQAACNNKASTVCPPPTNVRPFESHKLLQNSEAPISTRMSEHPESPNILDADIGTALDVEELEDVLVMREEDEVEVNGVALSSENGKAQLNVTQVAVRAHRGPRNKRLPTPRSALSPQAIRTQISLLSGRRYQAYAVREQSRNPKGPLPEVGLATSVHTVLRIKILGFYLRDNKDGIMIQVELAPPGEKHEKAFAPGTQDDPASRLAFRVTLKDKGGNSHVIYPSATEDSLSCVYKANSFVDWLEDGATDLVLRKRRKRHIYVPKHVITVHEDLKFFKGGGYILEDGTLVKELTERAVKRAATDNSDLEPSSKKVTK
ncbi:hypothetical protein BDW74DRAFT_175093 [Aspergillus multicolor]|uniref:uncharacterized protein n=1 Tax=Aspergillus multicolor TaxID=41759 RepID=UPI003CCCF555